MTRQPYVCVAYRPQLIGCSTLPPKTEEEELRHRKEYEEMVETYRKKSAHLESAGALADPHLGDRVKAEKERQALRKCGSLTSIWTVLMCVHREERRLRAKQFWTDDVFANWDKLCAFVIT